MNRLPCPPFPTPDAINFRGTGTEEGRGSLHLRGTVIHMLEIKFNKFKSHSRQYLKGVYMELNSETITPLINKHVIRSHPSGNTSHLPLLPSEGSERGSYRKNRLY